MSTPLHRSPHWKANHEYSTGQLVRFHAVNLHHQAQTLIHATHTTPSLQVLLQPISTILDLFTLNTDATLTSMSKDPTRYQEAVQSLRHARATLPPIQNLIAKTLIRRTLVNCIYSCIAITSLLNEEQTPPDPADQ